MFCALMTKNYQFWKFLCLKISTLNFADLLLYTVFHLKAFFLPKSCYEKWSFFNFYLITQNTKITISTKDTDEIFCSTHFLMPLVIPFHKYMVSNRSIFFHFLAPQTHRELGAFLKIERVHFFGIKNLNIQKIYNSRRFAIR